MYEAPKKNSTSVISERGLGVALAALGIFGAFLVYIGIAQPLGSGPTILPLISTVSIAVLGIVIAIRGSPLGVRPALRWNRNVLQLLGIILLIALHAALLSRLGFLIVGTVMQISLFLILGKRNILKILFVSITITGLLDYIISHIFMVPLPAGPLLTLITRL